MAKPSPRSSLRGQESTLATTWNAVTSGGNHGCTTRTDNTLWCWGRNQFGQLDPGDTTQRTSPVQLPGVTVTGVYAGPQADATFTIL